MNTRLPLNAKGEELITLSKSDLSAAIVRFKSARPPEKKDPALLGGEQVISPRSYAEIAEIVRETGREIVHVIRRAQVEQQLKMWNLSEHVPRFLSAGYRQLIDLLHLTEKDIRALGVTKDADVRRATSLVTRLQQEHRQMSLGMDKNFIDPDTADIRTWLTKRSLGEFAKV